MSDKKVVLGQYKGLTMKTRPAMISEREIDDCLQMALEEAAQTRTVTDRPVAEGDTAIIDFEGFQDGVAFAGGKGSNYPLVIGSHSFIDGFEEQLIGAEVGASVRVEVTFPERYQAPELAGKPAVFLCMVHGIQEKIVPELTDDFVRDKFGCDTVEQCREMMKEQMLDQRQQQMEENRIQALILRVVSDSEAEVDAAETDTLMGEQINAIRINLMQQGLTLEQYFDMSGLTREQLERSIRPQVERQQKTQRVLAAIAEAEGITVGPEAMDEYLTGMASNYGMDLETLKSRLDEETMNNIHADLVSQAAIDVIVKNAIEE